MRLFKRAWNIQIGTLEVSNLHCVFHVKKTLKPAPNTAEIAIYNLAKEHRDYLSKTKKLTCRIEAGYEEGVSQIFLGQVRSAKSKWEGADCITEISTGDSEEEIRKAQLRVPVGPKASPGDVLTSIAGALKVQPGNLQRVADELRNKGKTIFAKHTQLSGSASRNLTDFCRAADLEWTIEDGALLLVNKDLALDKKHILLNANSGLIGAPTLDAEGKINLKCLMIPGIRPAQALKVESEEVNGFFRAEQISYSGETNGHTWEIEIEGKLL